VEFVADNIKLDDAIFAAEQANKLVVEEGMSFRDAYLQVAQGLKSE
jgi:argininosuccinate lyase